MPFTLQGILELLATDRVEVIPLAALTRHEPVTGGPAGPSPITELNGVPCVLEQRVTDFSWQMGEQASRLFHYTGRKRGSHADCMIAAAAILAGNGLATRNTKDFEKFVPLGLLLMPVATVG